MTNTLKETSKKNDSNLKESIINYYKTLNNKDIDENSSEFINGYDKLIDAVIDKIYQKSNIDIFCSFIPTSTPKGKIPVDIIKYVNKDGDVDKGRILQLNDASSFSLEDVVTGDTSTASGVIKHIEDNFIYVELTTIDEFILETINGGVTTIENYFSNEWSVSVLLENFFPSVDVVTGENPEDSNEVDFITKMINISPKTRNVKTGWTLEYLQDKMAITKQTNEDFFNSLIDKLFIVIENSEKQKVISYMKNNAFVRNPIALTNSVGNNGGIVNVYGELYARINQSIGAIGTNTAIAGKYSVLASSNVYAGLLTHLGNSNLVFMDGYVLLPNGVKMIEDGYSTSDYLLVTLADNETNNSAIIYSPYAYNVVSTLDSKTLKEVVKAQIRSDVVLNELVELKNGKSTMMELTLVTDFNANIPF